MNQTSEEVAEGHRSRRQLLKLAGAAGVAGAAALVALPDAASATDGSAVLAGTSNSSTAMTTIAMTATTSANGALYANASTSTANAWGVIAAGAGLGDVKLLGTGRLQFSAHPSTGQVAPSVTPASPELAMSDVGVLWAGETTTNTWRRMNTVRVDKSDGSGSPFVPFRLYNSLLSTPLAAGGTRDITAAGVGGIPANAIAVFGNLTAVSVGSSFPSAGYLTMYPKGVARPHVSNVNMTAGGHIFPNSFVCGLAGGKLTVYSTEASHILIDVFAYMQ